MNSKKVFFIMAGSLGLISLLAVGILVLGNNILKKDSAELIELKLESRLLEEQQTALIQANKAIEEYAELEMIAQAIVPQDKDQARAVREIVKSAQGANVVLQSISFPSSTLGQEQPKVAAPAPDGATPSPAAPKTPTITQVKPVEGIPGVFSLEIAIQSDAASPAPYFNFLDFLARLEQNRRTAQVSTINIQPDGADSNLLTFSLIVNVYIKP